MNRQDRGRILGGLWTMLVILTAQSALAEIDAQEKTVDAICLTERPAIMEGETTNLHAWVLTRDGQSLPISWQVSDGTVRGTGAERQWDLSSIRTQPGEPYKKVTATLRAAAMDLGDAGCAVEVFIAKKEPTGGEEAPTGTRGGRMTGRRYLLPEDTELSGYGLYSYLLLGEKPQNEEKTTRYLKTLEASLQIMNKLQALSRHVRPRQLNATYIPVTELPKGKEDDPDFAKRVLAVYDFARAQVLLNKFEKTYDQGPYLVSVKAPLSQETGPVSFQIFQNFTGVIPDLAARGVRNFEYLAAQERTWTEQSMRVLAFKSRNLIAVAGKETPKVAGSLKTMIQFIKLGE
jgi:hypothetical protein